MTADEAVAPADLRAFAETTRAALSEEPSMSARAAELRVTQPLLETLGWDLHDGAVVPGFRAGETEVGFALRADGEPRALVETVAPATGLTSEDGDRLLDAMRAAGVDRGLLTDGHSVAVAVRLGGETRHRRIDVDALPEHADALSRFAPAALAGDERTAAARALADRREGVAEALRTDLLSATDGRCEAELRAAVDAFLDRLIGELGDDGVRSGGTAESDGDATREAAVEESDESGESDDSGVSPPAEEIETADGESSGAASDREFVVRFFDGGTSVGAVGGSTPLSALLQAAELLERQRAVLRGLSTPWRPEEDEQAVLRDEPAGNGPTCQLPTGHHLATDLSREEVRATVDALAETGGLRVMFQGDW